MFTPMMAAGGAEDGYRIARSLRLNSADSARMSLSAAGARTSAKKTTLSFWLRRWKFNTHLATIFGAGSSGDVLRFYNDGLEFYLAAQGAGYLQCSAVKLTDPSAWYHVYVAIDTTLATANDRIQILVNGVALAVAARSNPTQNYDLVSLLASSVTQQIGANNGASFGDFLIAEFHAIDGTIVPVSSFLDANLNPKQYTGSYGNKGFYLDFSDPTNTTTLGLDRSGNGYNFTATNISVSAGVGNDSLTDSPTTYDDGTPHGTFGILDSRPPKFSGTISNGWDNAPSVNRSVGSTFVMRGSDIYYFEMTASSTDNNCGVGPQNYSNSQFGIASEESVQYRADGRVYYKNSLLATYTTFAAGDTVGCAYQPSTGKVYFRDKNGVFVNSGDPVAGTGFVKQLPADEKVGGYAGSSIASMNYGQRPFVLGLPTGLKRCCTCDLSDSESAITGGSFTGNASATGPLVDLGGTPSAMTINGNAVTFGTHAEKTATGVRIITSSASYNASGSNTFTATIPAASKRKVARAQVN